VAAAEKGRRAGDEVASPEAGVQLSARSAAACVSRAGSVMAVQSESNSCFLYRGWLLRLIVLVGEYVVDVDSWRW